MRPVRVPGGRSNGPRGLSSFGRGSVAFVQAVAGSAVHVGSRASVMARCGHFSAGLAARPAVFEGAKMPYSTSTSTLVRAPRSEVWRALTEPALVKQYFFGTNLETTWQIGAPLWFRGEWEGKAYEDRGTVLAFEPERTLSYNYWSSFSGHADEPERRQVIVFKLAEEGDAIRVTVEQSNVDSQERADHSAENWRGVLAKLKEFVERRAG
jgi:uncharacterized protein YndB with AHSA1/START domain